MVDSSGFIKVSCVVPTYNNSCSQIYASLNSVLNSRYPVSELIVVDDGSENDFSERVVDQLPMNEHTSIIYHKQSNKGPSSARNCGVNLATNDWLVFLDADDTLLPDGILSKVSLVEEVSSVSLGGVFGSFIWSDSDRLQVFNSVGRCVDRDEIGVLGRAPGGLPSYLIRRDVYLSVGGLDESLIFNEDFDLILRIIARGYEVRGVSAPGFVRSVNPGSLTRSNMKRSLAGGRVFLRKAWRDELLSKNEVFRRYSLNLLVSVKYSMISFCENVLK